MYNNKENKLKLLMLIKNKVDHQVGTDKVVGKISIGLDRDDMYELEIEDWEYFESLLNKLQKEGIFYFQTYTDEQISNAENEGTLYPIMVIVDENFFKKCSKLIKEEKKQIYLIEIVRPKEIESVYKMLLNKDDKKVFDGDRSKKCWELLLRLAVNEEKSKKGKLQLSDYIKKEDYKSSFDYINSNSDNPFYEKYEKTPILEAERGYIKPTIELKFISIKAFITRRNKANNQK